MTSRHTLGYGIHSPKLYDVAHFVLPDTTPYYVFSRIESRRDKLLRTDTEIEVVDYGTGRSGRRRVCDIARRSLKPRREAQLLMRLAVWGKARRIVELGTCLGVTTAYLASTASDVEVMTFEGSNELLKVARGLWEELGLRNIRVVEGNIDDTCRRAICEWKEHVDFVFFDANHTGDATLRYFRLMADKVHEQSIFVFDDIYASEDMTKAWRTICADERVTAGFDLYSMGIVFFDRHLEKKIYTIRF